MRKAFGEVTMIKEAPSRRSNLAEEIWTQIILNTQEVLQETRKESYVV